MTMLGKLTALPRDLLAGFKRPTSKGMEGKGKGREIGEGRG